MPIARGWKNPNRFQSASRARVLLYHKPVGELVTRSDPEGRPTVFSRLPPGRWVAVGRLDFNTSGLLLFTDSGELANRLMHPRYELEREYAVRVHGAARPARKTSRGHRLWRTARPPSTASSRRRNARSRATNRWYRVVLREGRNREVRRLFEAVGTPVSRLMRVRYGPVELPADLAPGSWRELGRNAFPVILQKARNRLNFRSVWWCNVTDGLRPIFCLSLENVIEPVVAGMGYELVDVQASNGGRLLRLFIDKPGGINVDDCAAVSRQLSAGVRGRRASTTTGWRCPRRGSTGRCARRLISPASPGQKAEVRMRTPDATAAPEVRRRAAGRRSGAGEDGSWTDRRWRWRSRISTGRSWCRNL